MVYALRQPAVLLGMVLGFLLGVVLRAVVQDAAASGLRRRRLRTVGASRGRGWSPRRGWGAYLDPYGTVAVALSGVGWGKRPEPRGRGRSDLWNLVAALLVHGALYGTGCCRCETFSTCDGSRGIGDAASPSREIRV